MPEPMGRPDQPAGRYREISGVFTARVLGTRSWDVPAPVPGWAARDVVRHLVEWLPAFLASGSAVRLPALPSVDDDPVTAWQVHTDAVQALLDDPATAGLTLSNPHIGEIPVDRAIDQFYTSDVFMHTWDLARATGQDWSPPAAASEESLGFAPNMLTPDYQGEGKAFAPRISVPDEAPPLDRLLGLSGRDPAWKPA